MGHLDKDAAELHVELVDKSTDEDNDELLTDFLEQAYPRKVNQDN